jgi:hypothetical protein
MLTVLAVVEQMALEKEKNALCPGAMTSLDVNNNYPY